MVAAAEQPEGPMGAGGAGWGAGWELASECEVRMPGKGQDLPGPAVAVQACPSASR